MALNSRDIQEDFKRAIEEKNKDFLSKFQKEILEATKSVDDMQLEFKKHMPSMNEDRNSRDILDSIKTSKEKEEKDLESNISKGQSEEKILNGFSEEELNEVDEDTGLTKRQEILKTIYKTAVEERHKLRSDIYVRQIKDRNISIEDHNYLKLLEYDKYICKIDLKFKSGTGKYISEEDKDIAKLEEKQMYGESKSEETLTKEHEKSVSYIRELNEKIGDKAEEILEVIDNMEKGNLTNSMEKYRLLHEEYMGLNNELQIVTPSLNELVLQEKNRTEQENVTKDNLGSYEEKVNRVSQISDKDLSKKAEVISRMDSIQNDATSQSAEVQEINKDLVGKKLEKAEELLQSDDSEISINSANELVEDAKQISGVNNDLTSGAEYDEIIDTNAQHKIEVSNNSDNYSNFQLDCTRMTNTMLEANENQKSREEREAKVKEKIQEVSKDLKR